MSADLLLFNKHVEEASFQMGVDDGMWGIADENPQPLTIPIVLIWILTNFGSSIAERVYFRFDISGYPSQAPTACPWDITTNQRLQNDLWPKGNENINSVFNPNWNNGTSLYCPCDRMAIHGHVQWQNDYPEWWWRSDFKIDKYLNFIHKLLNNVTK